jgi:S1-C subfamily serine protease
MYRSSLLLAATLLSTVVSVQSAAVAQSSEEIGVIAKAITVEIKSASNSKFGSGILLQRQGDIYTVLTAGHVVADDNAFTFTTSDGFVHQSLANSIRRAGNGIDLAVLKFQSSRSYTLANIGTSNSLVYGSLVYVAGFPLATDVIDSRVFNFTEGKISGKATQTNKNGYSLIYTRCSSF